MTINTPTISPFLSRFVEVYAVGKPATELAAISYLDAALRRCVETVADRIDCESCQAILELERYFNPHDPVACAMTPEKLLPVLASFLHPPWLRPDRVVQAAQWRFAAALLNAVEVQAVERQPVVADSDFHDEIAWLRSLIASGLRRTTR
jgi:hypothetical protein